MAIPPVPCIVTRKYLRGGALARIRRPIWQSQSRLLPVAAERRCSAVDPADHGNEDGVAAGSSGTVHATACSEALGAKALSQEATRVQAFSLSRVGLVETGSVLLSEARAMVRSGQAVWVAGRVGGRPEVIGVEEPSDPTAAGSGLLVRAHAVGA